MLAAAISFLLCKNLLDGLGDLCKIAAGHNADVVEMGHRREGIRLFDTASIATSIVMLGEMSMTFMNEDIIMSASSTTATPSALAATLMSTYQDFPAFRGCWRRKTWCAPLRSSHLPVPPI